MHANFYHWHNRVELKPETSILLSRWNAAKTFAEDITADDTISLIRLALFGTVESDFASRYSEALVKLEPTFPPANNTELLCVMATASLFSTLGSSTHEADAVALGVIARAFRPDRIRPISNELLDRASTYIATESERVRPNPQLDANCRALQKAVDDSSLAENPKAIELLGSAAVSLATVFHRISEENQFTWWLLARRSPLLGTRREWLPAKEYVLAAAVEAAERVNVLPPPHSVDALIEEVLTHCKKNTISATNVSEIIDKSNVDFARKISVRSGSHVVCPISSLVADRALHGKVSDHSLEQANIARSLKLELIEIARQYFRELMFTRALTELQ